MSDFNIFLNMSHYIGGRYDLVQAGGGNTSVKTDAGTMYIKSSGYLLSEVDERKGFSLVDNTRVLSVFNDPIFKQSISKREKDSVANEMMAMTLIEGERPSIETFLHSLMYKYTSHVHSVAVNILASNVNWRSLLSSIDSKALFIEYKTPGIELAFEMKEKLEQYVAIYTVKPKVVFLQNHGLIVSSDSYEELEKITEEIVKKSENTAGLNLDRYRWSTNIDRLITSCTSERWCAYLSEDSYINDILKKQKSLYFKLPFCPDGLVYCGFTAIELNGLNDHENISKYYENYCEIPKVVIYKDFVYLIAKDLKKAKLIEDVLKNNLMILLYCKEDIQCLSDSELAYLGNWEAEKYRQNK